MKPYVIDHKSPWLLDDSKKVECANKLAELEGQAVRYKLGDESPYKPLFWIDAKLVVNA
jgi:hypothetical protein